MKDKFNRPAKPTRLFWLVLLVLTIVSSGGLTYSRYVTEWKTQPTVAQGPAFYFRSNLLKEESENAVYAIDRQTAAFDIELYNYADSLRVTDGTIDYTVSAEGASVSESSGTLTGEMKKQTITVTPDNPRKDKITVTAVSSAPYAQTLKATFEFKQGSTYKIEDVAGQSAAVLTMTCTEVGENISIILPGDVIPDTTNSYVAYADGGCTFTPPSKGVYSLVLLKTNASQVLSGAGDFGDSITVSTS